MTREPCVAGQFYPADSALLAAKIDAMLEAATAAPVSGKVIALQVPHAGYDYSGPTAARGYVLWRGLAGVTVVMVGTSHRALIDRAAVFARGSWRSPLGRTAVDEAFARRLIAADSFCVELPQAHGLEHSIEVQLPFLQRVMGDFQIVPVMVLKPSWDECLRLGRAIAAAVGERPVVLLASTDLYHGYSYNEAKATDSATMAAVGKFDPQRLYAMLEKGEAQACGGYGLVAVMIAARLLGADRAVVIDYTNSNDVTGERGGYCVGYSAVAFVSGDSSGSFELNDDEQNALLVLARQTIADQLQGRPTAVPRFDSPRLNEPRGVFVTLHRQGELRGCIGYPEAVKPLGVAVAEMAVAAAFEDPRFPPVTADELDAIDIEITVLSPLAPITPEQVVVGKHGLVIRRGGRSGLLLPQVPVEQNWNREQYLDGLCRKAGLPAGAWRDPATRLFAFTGQVFGEKASRRAGKRH